MHFKVDVFLTLHSLLPAPQNPRQQVRSRQPRQAAPNDGNPDYAPRPRTRCRPARHTVKVNSGRGIGMSGRATLRSQAFVHKPAPGKLRRQTDAEHGSTEAR